MVLDEKNNVVPSAVETEPTQEKAKNPLQELLKEIAVTSVAPDVKVRFQVVIESLNNLIREVAAKKEIILDKKRVIKEKLELLRSFKSITIDENEFKRSHASTEEYLKILEKMLVEVEQDRDFYLSLISDVPPKTILVFKFETDDFGYHLEQRIKAIKKYIKTAMRDLSVSFSRYSFGLDAQINQLNYVEAVAKNKENNLPSE